MLGVCVVVAIALLLSSCKPDEPVGNRPPETRLFLDSIALTGPDRLTTQVQLYWSGDDPDGFIRGFEISTDGQTWNFTPDTDSLFTFLIEAQTDTFDVQFWVRAVDDQDLRDPSPAQLTLPLRNSAPTVQFNSTFAPRDSVFSVITVSWTLSDLEGVETIDAVEVKLNNGDWFMLPTTTVNTISFRATDPTAAGTTTANVYTGSVPNANTINDFRVGAENVVYIRARDNGGLLSPEDTSNTVFVRRQTSNVLVLDTWSGNPNAADVYLPILNSASTFGGVDYINLMDTNNVPKLLNVTNGLLFQQYDAIFWYSNRNSLDLFEDSEGLLQQHLNRGGKLLMILPLASTIDSTTSAVFRLAPITSIAATMTNGRLPGNGVGVITPQSPAGAGYPTLANNAASLMTSINPVWPSSSAEVVYRGNLVQSSGAAWEDTDVLCVKSRSGANVNVIYAAVPLHQMGPVSELEAFFVKVKDEFNW